MNLTDTLYAIGSKTGNGVNLYIYPTSVTYNKDKAQRALEDFALRGDSDTCYVLVTLSAEGINTAQGYNEV